jgi:hypothetical protein
MTTNLSVENADRQWRIVLATERDKRRIHVAINRGLGLPDNASVGAQSYAVHNTDRRPAAEQAAAFYEAYQQMGDLPDNSGLSAERSAIADWLTAEANRADVNGFEPDEWGQRLHELVDRLRSGVDMATEARMVQDAADRAEGAWLRRQR